MSDPLISVVVCTYNRKDLLTGCLQSLADQTLDQTMFEVIVINNNSTDNTQGVSEAFSKRHINFKTYIETNQGLSYARNRGWQEARGNYVAYIDDDAKANPDWLEEMYGFIRRHPEVHVFGGPYDGFSLIEIPSWFPPEYGTFTIGDEERPLIAGKEFINGSNLVIHKDIFDKFGGFDTELGMKAGKISYGEETKLLVKLYENNIVIYYVPTMKVKHLIAQYKLSLKWMLLSHFASGKVTARTFGITQSPNISFKALLNNTIYSFKKLRTYKGIPLKRKVYYSFGDLFYCLGVFVEGLKSGR